MEREEGKREERVTGSEEREKREAREEKEREGGYSHKEQNTVCVASFPGPAQFSVACSMEEREGLVSFLTSRVNCVLYMFNCQYTRIAVSMDYCVLYISALSP